MMAAGAGCMLALIGCATGLTSASLLEDRRLIDRAAFDLNCAEPMAVTKLDAKTRGVRGCGRQATYVQLCDGPADNVTRSCVWVMNNGNRGDF
jgi:hypothetical protein